MAAAEPSFRISIDSISEGFNEFSPLLENAPSITYKGSVAPNVPAPRTSILISAPASPPFCNISTPGALPCKAAATECPICLLSSFAGTVATDAVKLDFF